MPATPDRIFAKTLRINATEPERRLWQILRAHRLGGLKFRRQVPMDGYFACFLCFRARLIIEADGGQHSEAVDSTRDQHFAARGFATLRVRNNDIMSNPDGVATEILRVALQRLK